MCAFLARSRAIKHTFFENTMKILIISLIFVFLGLFVYPVLYSIIAKKEVKEENFIIRFINRLTLDRLNSKHNKIYGFTLFCGKQGGGKTYSAVKYCYDLCKKYGSLLVSNTPLNAPADIQYIYITNLSDIEYLPKSDSYVIFLDEIQTLFDTKNFDDIFYTMFCQLRKRNIKLVGTAQVFDRVALKLREQVHNLYYCRTFFGCVTRVKEYFPFINSSGKLSNKDTFGLSTRFYVQTDVIRSMYDTYYKIEMGR